MLKNRIATHSFTKNLTRFCRHIATLPFSVHRRFSKEVMQRITQVITSNELLHSGEICFVIEVNLSLRELLAKKTAVARAVEVFSNLRIWDTEQNNGVLIYLLMADHDFEILADRGLHHQVDEVVWAQISSEMERLFKRGDFESGVVYGIENISALLAKHFPPFQKNTNELSDKPIIL